MKPTHDLWWPFLWGHKLWAHCQIIPKSRYIMISEKITKHHRQFPSKTGWLYFWQKIFHVLTPQVDSCTEAPQAQWEEGTCHMAKYHDAAGIHRVFTVSSPSKIGREESTLNQLPGGEKPDPFAKYDQHLPHSEHKTSTWFIEVPFREKSISFRMP